jgi:hypothetical protein
VPAIGIGPAGHGAITQSFCMNRPCKVAIDCIGPTGEIDWPVMNVSAEAPDPFEYVGWRWTQANYRPPCLACTDPVTYDAKDCQGHDFSVLSQAIADLIAQLNAEFCQSNPQIPRFTNTPQTATVYCADGTAFSYTVPGGMFIANLAPTLDPAASPDEIAEVERAIQEAVNARALAYAEQQATLQKCCVTSPAPNPGHVPYDPLHIIGQDGWACVNDHLTGDPMFAINGSGFTFSISAGVLPTGTHLVQISDNEAALAGDINTPGSYTFTLLATNAQGQSVSQTYSIDIFGITNPALPDASSGVAYSAQLTTLGGDAPVSFVLDPASTLPPGLTLDSATGIISGTPTTPGTYTFDIQIIAAEAVVTNPPAVTMASQVFPTTQPGVPSHIQFTFNLTDLLVGQLYLISYTYTPSGGQPTTASQWFTASAANQVVLSPLFEGVGAYHLDFPSATNPTIAPIASPPTIPAPTFTSGSSPYGSQWHRCTFSNLVIGQMYKIGSNQPFAAYDSTIIQDVFLDPCSGIVLVP